jgi:Fe-S cluster assembly protein SufD
MEKPAAAPSAWPAWFQAEQSAALAEYEKLPVPVRKDESWRFANLKALDLSAFIDAAPVASEGRLINASTGLKQTSAKLILGNNSLLHREAAALPKGVILETLESAATNHADLFKKYFMAQPVELGSRKYAALHKARVAGGAFLFVPANTSVELPIELFQWVEGANASVFPHTLIVCGENSRVTVVDYFKSADHLPAFACGVNDLHLARGAKLTYISVQDWSSETTAFHLNSTIVDRDATATALIANFGGAFIRGESLSRLVGEGSRSEMYSINPVEGTREIDQRTLQDHVAPNATSDLLYLNALDDKSRTIFAGLIKVQPGARGLPEGQKPHPQRRCRPELHARPGNPERRSPLQPRRHQRSGQRRRTFLHGSPRHPGRQSPPPDRERVLQQPPHPHRKRSPPPSPRRPPRRPPSHRLTF